MLHWNKALSLVETSHMTCSSQSENIGPKSRCRYLPSQMTTSTLKDCSFIDNLSLKIPSLDEKQFKAYPCDNILNWISKYRATHRHIIPSTFLWPHTCLGHVHLMLSTRKFTSNNWISTFCSQYDSLGQDIEVSPSVWPDGNFFKK